MEQDRIRAMAKALDGDVAERGMLFPWGRTQSGDMTWAVPGIAYEPYRAMARLLERGYQPGTGDEAGVRDAFEAAGGAMTGSLAARLPVRRGVDSVKGAYLDARYKNKESIPGITMIDEAGYPDAFVIPERDYLGPFKSNAEALRAARDYADNAGLATAQGMSRLDAMYPAGQGGFVGVQKRHMNEVFGDLSPANTRGKRTDRFRLVEDDGNP